MSRAAACGAEVAAGVVWVGVSKRAVEQASKTKQFGSRPIVAQMIEKEICDATR